MRYLTFALAKGRLASKSLEMFEKIGITCEEMKDKGSRKLIFTNEDLKCRFFLAKANDVPTYVEYGAADIGIVGKDTILEEGRKLYEVLDLFLGEMGKFTTDKLSLKKLIFTSRNTKNQKEEVQSHYDIGNDFYQLWLDETMSYSCAYFKQESDSLYTAQVQKAERILQKLYLKKGMSVLDIGCGWGYLLIKAAKEYGINGVGITLSEEQLKEFQKRIVEEHLEDQLTVKLMDYRDIPQYGKRFDRVISVGMVEHVGRGNYQLFINCVKKVMEPGGLFLLHFISGLKEHEGDPWIKKYIFPGGVVPSLREMLHSAAEDERLVFRL